MRAPVLRISSVHQDRHHRASPFYGRLSALATRQAERKLAAPLIARGHRTTASAGEMFMLVALV